VAFYALEFLIGRGLGQHLFELEHVLHAVHHPGGGGLAVAAGATGFLIIGLDAFRQIQVGHEAYVRFVYPHTEGDGGHHYQTVFPQKSVLVLLPLLARKASVVGQGVESLLHQPVGRLFHFVARQAIDNAGIRGMLTAQKAQQLRAGVLLGFYAVLDIGPVKARDELPGVFQLQALDDFTAGAGIGGGGEGDARHLGKLFVQQAELQIIRAEVVPPLGYAVGFIYREQRQRHLMQQFQHTRLYQALRRYVQQLDLPAPQTLLYGPLLIGAEAGIQIGSGNAQLCQGIDLILHERDQRRNHHRQALAGQGRDLVTQGFATPSRHQHQRIRSFAKALNDRFLLTAKGGVAKGVLQNVHRGVGHGGAVYRLDGGNAPKPGMATANIFHPSSFMLCGKASGG
jgi:hypothetical protein